MSAPSNSGLSVELLLRVIDVKYGCFTLLYFYPVYLSVDRAGHLWVCDSSNNRVQVFKLDGEFLTKFGAFGTGAGELKSPVSTAVLSDGKMIFIVSRFLHRSPIFPDSCYRHGYRL